MRSRSWIHRPNAWTTTAITCFGLANAIVMTAVAGDAEQGQALFEKTFSARWAPAFNANACVDCHRMGGVGGAGDSQFNARILGIESLQVPVNASNLQIGRFVASFYPGLVGSDGTASTVAPLPHFGGSSEQQNRKAEWMHQLGGERSLAGGPATQPDLKAELASSIRHVSTIAGGRFALTAKTFHRNTPALFGAGLIDAVTDEQIEQQAWLQRREPRVSGRPATLNGGGIGRFGWRANVATLEGFTRQACENELGLRVESDATANRFLVSDLSKQELHSLTEFMRSLPAPSSIRPTDPEQRELVDRGERLFEQVGCSVCHVQTMGPAQNLYSDLLLHDMGEKLRGPSTADPSIYASNEIILQPTVVARTNSNYHGSGVTFTPGSASPSSRTPSFSPGSMSKRTKTFVRPYQVRPEPIQFVRAASPNTGLSPFRRGSPSKVRRNQVRATNVSQEWRTAPLWGLRDSAPYLHDGRAATIDEAIQMHDGESKWSRRRYQLLKQGDQDAVLAFLGTFAAPAGVPQASDLPTHGP